MKRSLDTPALHRILMAYRPLYLRGLVVDGQYRLPPSEPSGAAPGGSRRLLLVALVRLHHHFFHDRSRPR